MNNVFLKLSIIVCLLFAIGFVVAKKNSSSCGDECVTDSTVKESCSSCAGCAAGGCGDKKVNLDDIDLLSDLAEEGLPKMIDFGKNECIPCKMMEPVLESMRKNYAGKLEVEFINTELDPASVEKFNIRGIPCQVFLDEAGNEIFRNVGFLPEEDIMAKWKEFGFEF